MCFTSKARKPNCVIMKFYIRDEKIGSNLKKLKSFSFRLVYLIKNKFSLIVLDFTTPAQVTNYQAQAHIFTDKIIKRRSYSVK